MTDHTNVFSELVLRERLKDTIRIKKAPEYTYLPTGELEEGWLPTSMRAFFALKGKEVQVETAAIVGCGPGVDAVLMLKIFNLRTLILTDVDSRIVDVALENVAENCTLASGQVKGTYGDLCEGLAGVGLSYDLIFENLPNLPSKSSVDITQDALSASFFDDSKYDDLPEAFTSNLLGLHFEFLRQAKRYLRKGGSVVCCIGARIPVEVIFKMFESLGYIPELLVQNMVRQFEAERVLAEYSRIEEVAKNTFKFFDLERALPHFLELTKEGLGPAELVKQLDNRATAISAEEAAWRHGLGGRVGIVGLVIRGLLSEA